MAVSLLKQKRQIISAESISKLVFQRMAINLTSTEMSFPEFVKKSWPILEPANPMIHSWYIDYLCEHLQAVTMGSIRRLLINMPPRKGKSNLVTVLWPVWSWTQKPWLRFLFCSYSANLSSKHSLDRRRVIESDWFRDNWGAVVRMAADQNQKQEYENTARGHMIATSVGGTATGKGGDVVVEDDMINPQKAESPAERYKSISMHKNVLSSRLDNLKTGIRVIVEQRTHAQDLTGYVLENESGWNHLVLPLVATKKVILEFPISGRRQERNEGELLDPSRQGEKEIADQKKDMGTRTFEAQCQQNPTSDEGNILKRHWWKFWHVLPDAIERWIISWDMSFKETKTGSFVVGQVWAKAGARFYLIDQFRARIDFNETLSAFITLTGKYPQATAKLVEDAANGPAIMAVLKQKISGIIPIPATGAKVARAQAIAPLVEAGNIYLPDPLQTTWVYDFIEEAAKFKGVAGEINDQVDAMSQALNWFTGRISSQARVTVI